METCDVTVACVLACVKLRVRALLLSEYRFRACPSRRGRSAGISSVGISVHGVLGLEGDVDLSTESLNLLPPPTMGDIVTSSPNQAGAGAVDAKRASGLTSAGAVDIRFPPRPEDMRRVASSSSSADARLECWPPSGTSSTLASSSSKSSRTIPGNLVATSLLLVLLRLRCAATGSPGASGLSPPRPVSLRVAASSSCSWPCPLLGR
mmetsp:Transcript_7120/g.16245  ORF Transcript_7120/g.16245 Transcript_7120/m.16245 type:complete len:207 (-) Transcript_7120:17-637(-)